jgi:NAD(P)-dependent dehydrogenase (short-subunit alcohol dehydrogenase family)
MVDAFTARGARVLGCARSREGIAALERESGGGGRFQRVDVSDDTDVARYSKSLVEKFGAPDLLINNAALINRNAPLWEVPADEFSTVIDVNIKGTANMIRHLVPAMIARGSGIVVNFSSGWGRSTSAEVAPYCATKFAIEGLTAALAQELPAGLAAIALNPGIIDTDMLRSSFGGAAGSYPNPAQWAKTAVPLISKLNHRDNGGSLTVGSRS